MSVAVVLAALGAAGVFLWISTMLDGGLFLPLKILLVVSAIYALITAGHGAIDAEQPCGFYINESHTHNLTGPPQNYPDVTHFHYIELCVTNNSASTNTYLAQVVMFMKAFLYIIGIYVFIFYIKRLADKRHMRGYD